jgi:hypothetical protein
VLSLLGLAAVAACYAVFLIGLHTIGVTGPLYGLIALAVFVGMLYALGATRPGP